MKLAILPKDEKYNIKSYLINGNYYTYDDALQIIKQWRLDLVEVCPINFISSIPGSGKTEWAIKRLLKNSEEKKSIFIYVSPTVNLIDQIMSNPDVKRNFIEHGNFHRIVFDSALTTDASFGVNLKSRNTDTIRLELIKKIKKAKLGDTFLITHATFLNIEDVLESSGNPISVIFDEDCEMVKDVYSIEFSNTLDEKNLLTHLFLEKVELKESLSGNGYPVYRLNLTDVTRVKQLARQDVFKQDDLKLIDLLTNKKLAVYAVYQDDVSNIKNIKFNIITLVSENIFVGFKSVTVLNSYFEKSMMYHILSKRHKMIDRSEVLNKSARNETLNKRIQQLAIYPLLTGTTELSKNSLTNFISVNEHAHNVLLNFYEKLCLFSRKRISVELFLTSVQHNTLFNQLDSRSNVSVKFFKDIFSTYKFPSKSSKNQTYRLIVKYLDKIFNHIVTENNRFSYQLPIIGAMNTALSIIKAMRTVETHNGISSMIQKKFPYSKFNRVNAMYATPTLMITNKSSVGKVVKSSFDHLKSLTSLSTKSHGLNGYQDNNAVIYLAALNPNPILKTFISCFIPDYSFKEHWVVSTILQCLYRTSLRNPESNDLIHLVVPNQDIANLVKIRLGGLPIIYRVDDSKQCRLVTPANFIHNDDKKEIFDKLKLTSQRGFYEPKVDRENHKKRAKKLEKLARVEEAKRHQKVQVKSNKDKIVVKREIEDFLASLTRGSNIPVSKVEVKSFEDKRRRTLNMLEDKYGLDANQEETIQRELNSLMIRWAEKRKARALKKLGF